MRYFLEIAYKGTDFCGFQIQENVQTVQGELNKVLSLLLKTPIETIGSGRTDTGVHCQKQFVHFDTENLIDIENLVYKLNKILSKSISINSLRIVKTEAHARFDALSRSYEYHIITKKSPFLNGLTYYYPTELDIEKMNHAAFFLLQYTDFEAFSKVKTDVKTFNCTIIEAKWTQKNDRLVFQITANRFLRGMVRAIVGTLLDVGRNKISIYDFENIIKSKNRTKAGRAVPPEGLFLVDVVYPSDIFLT